MYVEREYRLDPAAVVLSSDDERLARRWQEDGTVLGVEGGEPPPDGSGEVLAFEVFGPRETWVRASALVSVAADDVDRAHDRALMVRLRAALLAAQAMDRWHELTVEDGRRLAEAGGRDTLGGAAVRAELAHALEEPDRGRAGAGVVDALRRARELLEVAP